MPLYFITGNKNKFREAQAILGDVILLDIDLPEIQDLDSQKIITAKLQSALTHHEGPFILEDISLTLDCLKGLPGPLIKWFLQTIGVEGIAAMAEKFDNHNATAKVVYGYAENKDHIRFFTGELRGSIVAPRGKRGFGFDFIFMPEGHSRTFSQMTLEEKNEISVRRIALEKLKKYLKNK